MMNGDDIWLLQLFINDEWWSFMVINALISWNHNQTADG